MLYTSPQACNGGRSNYVGAMTPKTSRMAGSESGPGAERVVPAAAAGGRSSARPAGAQRRAGAPPGSAAGLCGRVQQRPHPVRARGGAHLVTS